MPRLRTVAQNRTLYGGASVKQIDWPTGTDTTSFAFPGTTIAGIAINRSTGNLISNGDSGDCYTHSGITSSAGSPVSISISGTSAIDPATGNIVTKSGSTIYVNDPSSGVEVDSFTVSANVNALAVSASGDLYVIFFNGSEYQLTRYDGISNSNPQGFSFDFAVDMDFDGEGNIIAARRSSGIRIYDGNSYELIQEITMENGLDVDGVAIAPSGEMVWMSTDDNNIYINAKNKALIYEGETYVRA